MRRGVATLGALGLVCVSDAARAEVNVGAFAGVHTFSPNNRIGRLPGTGASTQLSNSWTMGARFSYLPNLRWAGELEVGTIPTESADGTGLNIPVVRLAALYNVLPRGRFRPFFLLGGGAFVASPSNSLAYVNDVRGAAMAGTGVFVGIGDWWGLRAEGRVYAFPGMAGSLAGIAFNREMILGIYARFPAPPPPEIAERPGVSLIADEDNDGVSDKLDKCPGEEGPVRNYGCPVDRDRDGDGLLDGDDRCPDDPGTVSLAGCKDTDEDNIVDSEDRCPAEAGIKELKGCPDRDGDGDGLADRLDKCPKEAETKNGYQDDDGCPDTAPVEPPPPPKPIPNVADIDFARGASTLTRDSLPILDSAAQVLLAEPEILLEVIGHTDGTGTEAQNQRLSASRADAVRLYLLRKGVPAARVKAVGKGASEPLVPDDTEENRARNRRVEFKLTTAPGG